MRKGWSTQRLVNTFPLWTDIRTDEQSLGQQLLTPIGGALDDLNLLVETTRLNLSLPTFRESEIGTFYSYKLPDDIQLTFQSNFVLIAPIVSGLQDNVYYRVEATSDNTIESFWDTAVPSRIDIRDPEIQSADFNIIASGVGSNLVINSFELPFSSTLEISVSGIYEAIQTYGDNVIIPTFYIDGTSEEGLDRTEEISFLYDGTKRSSFEFLTVSGIRLVGCDEIGEFQICTNKYQMNYLDPFRRDSRDLSFYDTSEARTLFWQLSRSDKLDLCIYDNSDATLRMDGFSSRSILQSFLLIDEHNNRIEIADFDLSERYIWAVGNQNLYLFSIDVELPDYSLLNKKQYDSPAVLVPNSYWVTSGEDIQIDYLWRRPITGLQKHRSWVEKPDGSIYSLENGVEVTYHTDSTSWILGEPEDKMIRNPEIYTINQYGSHVYTLETVFTNEEVYIDKKIIHSATMIPLKIFSLGFDAIGVSIKPDGNLLVVDSGWNTREIILHYDNMLIDSDKRMIYFRDNYSEVRIW